MGDLLGGSEEQTATTTSAPWEPQQQHLKDIFQGASDAYNNAKTKGPYKGNFFAGLNDKQKTGLATLTQFANGTGMDTSGLLTQFGQQGLQAGQQALDNSQGLYTMATGDPTQRTVQGADAYVNNDLLDSQIDAVGADVRRNLGSDLVGLNNTASATGNINSSRAGAAEAIMREGAADRLASTSAQMRGAAYDRGLGLSANQTQQQFTNGLAANGQLQSMGAQGMASLGQGLNSGYKSLQQALLEGDALQQDSQLGLDNDIAKFQHKSGYDFDNLNRYLGLVGGKYGSEGTQTQEVEKPGLLQQGLGMAAQAASIYSGFSDRRLKRDIRRTGKKLGGFDVYRYRYIWSDEETEGVIAQEVQAKRPEAVFALNGKLGVHYHMLNT